MTEPNVENVEIEGEGKVKETEVETIKPEDFANLQQRYDDLNSKIGDMGRVQGEKSNEISLLQNQLQMSERQVQDLQYAQRSAPAPESDAEQALADITSKLSEMDTDDDDYVSLQNQRVDLAIKVSEDRAIALASDAFREELNAEKVRGVEKEWVSAHPDFENPEMQAEIQKVLAKSGVHDVVSAYYDVKGKMSVAKLDELTAKMEETEKLANLKDGEKEVGKVVTGPGAGTQQKTQSKTQPGTEEYKAGMRAAFDDAA